eukprot:207837_1
MSQVEDAKIDNATSIPPFPIDAIKGNEIITLCVGQCGINVGQQYFSTIMNEHKIHTNGTFIGNTSPLPNINPIHKANTFFRYRDKYNQYVPRCLFIDIDSTTLDQVKSSAFGSLVDSSNIVGGTLGSGVVNWAKGHYTEGAEMIDLAIDSIRHEVEICDHLQGFITHHGITGGVGGGLSTLILLKVRDNYPANQSFACTVMPSQTAHSHIPSSFATYNTVLSVHQLSYNTDLCFQIDNGSLLEVCRNQCRLRSPSYDDINWVLSLILSGVTAPFRFQTQPSLMGHMKSMSQFHVCFPRLHFMSIAHAPYFGEHKYKFLNEDVDRIVNNVLDTDKVSAIDLCAGKILSCSLCYRCNGEDALNRMNKYHEQFATKFGEDFVTWIPTPYASCHVLDDHECYKEYAPLIATSVVNTTAIRYCYDWITRDFGKIFRRKAFLHWYKCEGMDEM